MTTKSSKKEKEIQPTHILWYRPQRKYQNSIMFAQAMVLVLHEPHSVIEIKFIGYDNGIEVALMHIAGALTQEHINFAVATDIESKTITVKNKSDPKDQRTLKFSYYNSETEGNTQDE